MPATTGPTTYAIALGGNRRGRAGPPERVLAAALAALGQGPGRLAAASPVTRSAPLGPSLRRFANAVVLLETSEAPEALLGRLKATERRFGRRRGRRWGQRALDLDLILWSGGGHRSRGLTIPHPAFAARAFVLDPLAAVAPLWRDPATGLTVRQLRARLLRRCPVDRRGRRA